MAVLRLSSSRRWLGAALLLASPAVLAQASAPAPTPAPIVAQPAPAVAPPPAAPAQATPAAAQAKPAAPESPPAKVDATPAAAEPDSANAATRASRHADELDRELGVAPADAAGEEQESLGWVVVRTVALLGAVLASIYLTLNVGLRKLMGLQGVAVGKASVVSVMERIPLDQRRTLFVLKAADEYLLVGGGEGGVQLLSKLDRDAVERIRSAKPPAAPVSLSPFLQKLLSRRTGGTPPPPGV